MLFNSFEYFLFLPAVFAIYWFALKGRLRLQNIFLLLASYVFYGWWDWRFLSLLFISSIADYNIGLWMSKTPERRNQKLLLYLSLAINLGILGFFKYYNFFLDSFIDLIQLFGLNAHPATLKIILPVGISFYTFQTLSYTIDIYRDKIKPTKDIVAFFCYVSFFPQLVAGPIERAGRLLPQFLRQRVFEYSQAKDGLRMILWGLFKKIAIADNCAIVVDTVFENYGAQSGSTLFIGLVFFAFQLYGDFSGYSDIAIGSAKLLGFKLMRNFNNPFLATNVEDFWRRWHISLTTWIRDYIFYSLPINKNHTYLIQYMRNLLVVFFFIGLWHGAKWTFVLWGLTYFVWILIEYSFRKITGIKQVTIRNDNKLPSPGEFFRMGSFFVINIIVVTMFRVEDFDHLMGYWKGMFNISLLSLPNIKSLYKLPLLIALISWEWRKRDKWHGLDFDEIPQGWRWFIYIILIGFILFHFGTEKPFVYFQF